MSTPYRIVGASCLAAFRPGHDYRPALDEIMGLGFNLVRVFGGPLPWCSQERQHVYDGLPTFCDEARARSLHVYVSALTETGTGYDPPQHVSEVVARVQGRDNVLFELANEPTHPTQKDLTPEYLAQIMTDRVPNTMTRGLGCADDDESIEYAAGDHVPIHLDRSRDHWNMVRRVREMLAISETVGRPAFNQEPIGAGEANIQGKRCADPAIFLTMSALNRLFNVGGIFHSEEGLFARPLGPTQRRCAEAYIRGSNVWPNDADRLQYLNVGHAGSPIVSGTFNNGDLSQPGCTRSYCGCIGPVGFNVTLGISDMNHPGAEIGNGWRWTQEVARDQGVIVRHVEYVGGRAHIVERQR
jgi:hypothetical protein